jgi:hypothetical protein
MVEEISKGEKKKFSGKKFLTHCRKNPWIISTIVLSIVVLFLLFGSFKITGKTISEKEASQKLLDLYTSQGIEGLSVSSVEKVSGVYQVNFDYKGQEVPLFLTLDGNMVGSLSEFPDDSENSNSPSPSTSKPVEVPKSDKPVAELFVMTHCPYGTQAEKGFVPFLEAFGENVDGKIRFVHYFMHGDIEEEETYRELCIREEQGDKYMEYLKCFLSGNGVVDSNYGLVMEGKNQTVCMKEVGVNIESVEECVSNGNAEEYYAQDSQLSQSYGVQGSPTLVVNGVVVSSGRSPSAYLSTVCGAFNNQPSECSSLSLSTQNPTAYFGWDSTASAGTNSAAMC